MEEIVITVDASCTRRRSGRCAFAVMLLKRCNHLRLFVIEDTKSGLRQTMNRIAIRIRDRDIGEDSTSTGLKCVG